MKRTTSSMAKLAMSILSAAVASTNLARADVIVMKNGDRITGEVKKVRDGKLYIDPAYAGELAVDLAEVASVDAEATFEIEMRDDREIDAQLVVSESGEQALIVDEVTVPVMLEDIKEMEEPEDFFDWESRTDLNADVSKGNTDSENYRLQSQAMVKHGRNRHTANLQLDREKTDGVTTKEQEEFGYLYGYNFTGQWYTLGSAEYERDPQRDLSKRVAVGGGIGYQFWEDPRRRFGISLGLDYLTEDIGDRDEESAALRWRLKFRREFFGGDLNFFHNHDIQSFVTGRSNNIFKTKTGLRFAFTDLLYGNMQVDFNYESDPVLNNDKDDLTVLMGVGLLLN